MASILNQKREVIKLELTKHGRKMLGMGIFQPEYYYFYDNSILYDSLYYNVYEDINNIENRILNESLTFRSLNNTINILDEPLGKSNKFNNFVPAWDLQILRGELTYKQNDSTYYKNKFTFSDIIYQLDSNIDGDVKIPVVLSDYILIDLQELNVSNDMENFEIEIVAFDEITGGKKIYIKDGKEVQFERKLLFSQKKANIIDDILYDDNELPLKYFDVDISEKDVAYYFDIQVDDEIDYDFIGITLNNNLNTVDRVFKGNEYDIEKDPRVQAAKDIKDRDKAPLRTTYQGPTKDEC